MSTNEFNKCLRSSVLLTTSLRLSFDCRAPPFHFPWGGSWKPRPPRAGACPNCPLRAVSPHGQSPALFEDGLPGHLFLSKILGPCLLACFSKCGVLLAQVGGVSFEKPLPDRIFRCSGSLSKDKSIEMSPQVPSCTNSFYLPPLQCYLKD